MTRPRTLPAAVLALPAWLAGSLALSACQNESTSPQVEAASEAAAGGEAVGPDAKPGIAASEGRLILPIVAGRPGAIYLRVRNESAEPARLVGIHVEGVERTEMHETKGGTMAKVDAVSVPAGDTVEFAPGAMHVMAFGIAGSLERGETTELTLTFEGGDKLSMPIRIETMAMDMDAMDMPPEGRDGAPPPAADMAGTHAH